MGLDGLRLRVSGEEPKLLLNSWDSVTSYVPKSLDKEHYYLRILA